MTPEQLAAAVEKLVEDRVRQGLPRTVENPAVLAKLGVLIGSADKKRSGRAS